MKKDLLSLIREQREVTNVVILTHNIDFVFIQNLLLDALRRCGAPRLTVFADAQCAAESYALQAPMLSHLGRRYRVVPVPMRSGFRFHPKAVLLSGRTRATLHIGSGNLTFGGWRENAELWCEYSSAEGTAEISAFRRYLGNLVKDLALSRAIFDELDEAFDPATRAWVRDLGEPSGLLARTGTGPALIEEMKRVVGPEGGDRLTICAPYFDAEAEALRRLPAELGVRQTLVLVDPAGTNLQAGSVADLPATIVLRSAAVHRASEGSERRCFLHAKFYAVEHGDEVILFLGSANCSRAALTLAGQRGNAELMAVRRLPVAQFQAEIVDEIEYGSEPPELAAVTEAEEPVAKSPAPQLLAARLEGDILGIAFFETPGWRVRSAVVDDVAVSVHLPRPGICECRVAAGARTVSLRGLIDGIPCGTARLWIDHEDTLASTAYRRSLETTVREKAQRSEWDLGDWCEVIEILCRDLDYSTSRGAASSRPDRGTRDGEEAKTTFTSEDLFAGDLQLPFRDSFIARDGRGDHISLEAILLRWFGRHHEEDSEAGDTSRDERRSPSAMTDDQPDEAVDHAEDVRVVAGGREPVEDPRVPEERDRKRAQKIVDQMAVTMSSGAYLESRHPGDLARDLKLAAVLLRMAGNRGWLSREEALAVTHRIWSALFLSAGGGDTTGWLAIRELEDPADVRRHLRSPSLAAALFAWSLEVPNEPTTPREAQVALALAIAISRQPWLWISENLEETATELASLLRATGESHDAASIRNRWDGLIKLGRALKRFERALATAEVSDLRSRNRSREVSQGELLWQGKLGYCVAEAPADRTSSEKVSVLLVQGTGEESRWIKAGFLNPVRGLFNEVGLLSESAGDIGDVEVLKDFVRRLQVGIVG